MRFNSKLILTNSGGIQEETSILKIPSLTARETTESPITVNVGTNTIISIDIVKGKGHIEENCFKQLLKREII